MSVQEFNLEVTPILPKALKRLEELTDNLWYSWNVEVRLLFEQLNHKLWMRVGHNPKLFLRNIDQAHLNKAANDPLFLKAYYQVISNYDAYCQSTEPRQNGTQLAKNDLIAYFCAEYGFHEGFPIYSGGLGILAGDHCKTASDMRLPFISVGLFYHQGYFTQIIDANGNQQATYSVNEPQHLPITAVLDDAGNEVYIEVQIAETQVSAKAWKTQVGHITLFLLDTNVPQNNEQDREITHKLYGGGQDVRIKQEIVLGIGGVRLLRKLGLAPTIWHMNEGHAAFMILERMRELIAQNQTFDTAIEIIGANTVFTTHTPVPAGHDHFSQEQIINYLGAYARDDLKMSQEAFLALGCWPNDNSDFNMTLLAMSGAQHMNGVSRLHGQISSKMEVCQKFWPELSPADNLMHHVTNGVHISSILSREWHELFDKTLGVAWRHHKSDVDFWKSIHNIPDKVFWNVKQTIKSRLLEVIRESLTAQHLRHQISETHLEHLLKYIDPNNPNILTIGFARRFATYKRATLLFTDKEKLRAILNDIDRPIVFIFAGKAHPKDIPGQDLLREIYKTSCDPEFMGKILLVQGYDLALSRRLVSGVDVWLNNPVYPLEASGTSGMKVAINGGINLSVLDGWWPESYDGENGWAIKPSPHNDNPVLRDHEDARSLYEVLQDEVIPLYYKKNQYGYSEDWVKKSKCSMATILPRFNTIRMLNDYLDKLYIPASLQGKRLNNDGYTKAQDLALWKKQVRNQWEGIHIRTVSTPETQMSYGETVSIQVAIDLNGLQAHDIKVELLLARKIYHPEILVPTENDLHKLWENHPKWTVTYPFIAEKPNNNEECLYTLNFKPDLCGGLSYRIRIYPIHSLLSDSYEMGMMKWV